MIDRIPNAIVVHAGARDQYQLPIALDEEGLLQALLTEAYLPMDCAWFRTTVGRVLPERVRSARFRPQLGSAKVRMSGGALAATFLKSLRRCPANGLNYRIETFLGGGARALAARGDSAVVSVNGCAAEAFRTGQGQPKYRVLFQFHPHARFMRRLISEEVERVPEARFSLMSEYEMTMPGGYYDRVCGESRLANGWIVASSFTARSLAEGGIPLDKISVVPYGVDADRFDGVEPRPARGRTFRVIFVGSMVQRKGLADLLEAIRLLKTSQIQVVLCGRGVIDAELIKKYGDRVAVEVKTNLSFNDLVSELKRSDLFALPSLAEGFGHAILEAMACGLPVLTTRNTCAPDVMEDGTEGFLVPIRSPGSIAEKLDWGARNRAHLAQMGEAAEARVRHFSWARFRSGFAEAYKAACRNVERDAHA